MKIKVKIFYRKGIWQKTTLTIKNKDLIELGLFEAIKKKLKHIEYQKILITHPN